MNLFTLFGTISINANDAKSEIEEVSGAADDLAKKLQATSDEAEKTGKNVGNEGKLGKSAVFWGNLAAGITEAGVKFLMKLPGAAISAAASVDAEMSAFQSTFGELADEAAAAYSNISAETNIFETRLKSVGREGYAQLKGAGIDANDALDESVRFLRIAADAAAYYDISLEDASSRIRSFMRGNVEAGDAIGLFTSQNQREIYSLEAYGKAWKDLNEAQRQTMLLNVAEDIYKQTGAIGQAAREGIEWANVNANMSESQAQSLATLGGPIKDSLLPALNELSHWLANEETQTRLAEFGESLGNIASVVFDGLLTAFDWLVQNGDAVGVALGAISTAMVVGAIATHPYAAAIMAVATGLALIAGGHDYDKEILGKYTKEDLDTLQRYVDAWNRLNELEAKAQYSTDWRVLMDYSEAQAAYNAASKEVDAIEGLKAAYQSWLTTQGHTADMPYLDVPVQIAGDAETVIQAGLDGMTLEAAVHMVPDYSSIQSAANIVGVDLGNGVDGSHASGLWRVPKDGYIARLHKDETILNSTDAETWRSGSNGTDVSRLEASMNTLASMMQQLVNNTGRGQTVVLDSGVLVGQLAPRIDSQLGTISTRKGRGN